MSDVKQMTLRLRYRRFLLIAWVYAVLWAGVVVGTMVWDTVGWAGRLLILAVCAFATPDAGSLFCSFSRYQERHGAPEARADGK